MKAKIGSEINLSETAFVSQSWTRSNQRKSEYDFTLRWFTPSEEIALCGHATLASARVLFDRMEQRRENETTIRFETKFKGVLTATINWETKRISINFPLTPVTPHTVMELSCLPQLLEYLLHPLDVNQIHSVHYASSTRYLFVRLHDENEEKGLLELSPNFQQLSTLQGKLITGLNYGFFNSVILLGDGVPLGIIVTVKGTSEFIHFYSRFFAPNLGVAEDPVIASQFKFEFELNKSSIFR